MVKYVEGNSQFSKAYYDFPNVFSPIKGLPLSLKRLATSMSRSNSNWQHQLIVFEFASKMKCSFVLIFLFVNSFAKGESEQVILDKILNPANVHIRPNLNSRKLTNVTIDLETKVSERCVLRMVLNLIDKSLFYGTTRLSQNLIWFTECFLLLSSL